MERADAAGGPAKEQEAKIKHAKKIAHAVTEGDRKVLQAAKAERQEKKKLQRAAKEEALAEATAAASKALGTKLYGVIYADPPWRFEVYDVDSGSDRNADNHYPTMLTEDIASLKVPAAKDAVLFLWATSAMLPDALSVMQAWGFTYKASCIWNKDKIGKGYWFRTKHEFLLVGTRGKIPAPSPGTQSPSVIDAPRGEHSVKPDIFRRLIIEMFPSVPRLEMFARGKVEGFDVWGNEAESADDAPKTNHVTPPRGGKKEGAGNGTESADDSGERENATKFAEPDDDDLRNPAHPLHRPRVAR